MLVPLQMSVLVSFVFAVDFGNPGTKNIDFSLNSCQSGFTVFLASLLPRLGLAETNFKGGNRIFQRRRGGCR